MSRRSVTVRLTPNEMSVVEALREKYDLDTLSGAIKLCIRSRSEYERSVKEEVE